MTEPDWAKVLNYLYQNNGKVIVPSEEDPNSESEGVTRPNINKLSSEIGSTEKELRQAIQFLGSNDLADYSLKSLDDSVTNQFGEKITDTGHEICLKADGFDVAHEREIKNRSQVINTSIMILTAILALTALIQATSSVFLLERPERYYMGSATIFILILIIIIGYVGTKNRSQ